MDIWNSYKDRISVGGKTKREALLKRETRMLKSKFPEGLSFHSVLVDNVERNAEIINSDNLNTKFIISMPGEDIDCGSIVEWMDNHWLVTEKDANTEIYAKAKMLQCNFLLKWVNDKDEIQEQWCIIEDGTKYLTGEYEDRNFIVTRGDSRIAMTISKNEETIKFNRESRFLIDDPDSGEQIAYALTKPLKVGRVYNGKGVYAFVLQETMTTDDDNQELGIADFYKHFSRPTSVQKSDETQDDTNSGKRVWL